MRALAIALLALAALPACANTDSMLEDVTYGNGDIEKLGLIHSRHEQQVAQQDAIPLIHLAQIAAVDGIGKVAPCPGVGMRALLDERNRIHIGKAHVA